MRYLFLLFMLVGLSFPCVVEAGEYTPSHNFYKIGYGENISTWWEHQNKNWDKVDLFLNHVANASTYPNLNSAVAANQTKTLLISKDISLSGNLTIPSTCDIVVYKGGRILLEGYTLTINGSFSAGQYNVFNSGDVVFGTPGREIFPDWFPNSDYGAKMSAAIASVKAVGGCRIKITKSAEITTAINVTNVTSGLIIEGYGCSFNGSVANPVLKAKLTTVLFDCTGSNNLQFRDFGIDTDATTYPAAAFLLARNSNGGGNGEHLFLNVRVNYVARFGVAAVYSYGSEANVYNNCVFVNRVAGAKVFYATGHNNIHPLSSVYVSIATGSQSNSVYNFYGCSMYNLGGTDSDIFYFDGVFDFHWHGGFMYNVKSDGSVGGRSMFYVNTANSTSDIVSIATLRCEAGTPAPLYNIYFDNAAVKSHALWSITNSRLSANTNTVYVSDNSTLNQLHYSEIVDAHSKGISVKYLVRSRVTMDGYPFVGRAGGLLEGCELSGSFSTFTIASSANSTFSDNQYAAKWYTPTALNYGPVTSITLAANTTTTTIANAAVTANSKIWLFPTSATAAADVGSASGVYISSKVAGVSYTITHPNTADVDKSFSALVLN